MQSNGGTIHTDRRRCAFTIIELLIVIGIISLLMAILLPALSASREAGNDLRCRANTRSIVIAFQGFADESSAGRRGDSDLPPIGPGRFLIEDFQESIYRIDEFWDGPDVERIAMGPDTQPMMCPAGPSGLERRSGIPCSNEAVGPTRNVTMGFNRRLHKGTRYLEDGTPFPFTARLTSRILNFPDVPLLFDVDGKAATDAGMMPYYAAPPIQLKVTDDIYSSGAFWFPSIRHRGRINIGFVGGHVLSSASPLSEPWARWEYQPEYQP